MFIVGEGGMKVCLTENKLGKTVEPWEHCRAILKREQGPPPPPPPHGRSSLTKSLMVFFTSLAR